ncbi:UDP-galactopyranose mutase [Desulfonauticus submarinus]|uniref:UDP-galactopyranose mutase n=1 Tax=Desulfonauticus submarinus TaxID=206665 RepID=A0A1H0BEQ0_9BACT|nr:FAD-dependent oxidoreductase [Desulfonauticus submarinus]SDN44112.1 UDP-galactopyranose mutase [Desulfonauticus submarinus]
MKQIKYLIIGAGPTGLGAGYRLKELGENNFLILEKNSYPGGLSASFRDKKGFTWDIGGHVIFSHYKYFDNLLEKLLSKDFLSHQRKAFIRLENTWIPYPFQNNIRYLPPHLRWKCIEGILDKPSILPTNFKEWILSTFGEGIASLFLLPYNFKVWATPLEKMNFQWIGERVSVINLKRILKNIILEQDDVSWGPNNLFKFPLVGGTGEIFRRLANKINNNILYNKKIISIDINRKKITCLDGTKFKYEFILNTSPLDQLVLETIKPTNMPNIMEAASKLKHNSVFITGIGINHLKKNDKCWMYFPENNCPFYRVTNFHNYSPNNTPRPGLQTAFMAETSYSDYKKENLSLISEQTIKGLIQSSLMTPKQKNKIISIWEFKAEYGYPIPCLERDQALKTIHSFLEAHQIFSRGRFGGWKYEVGNMDHSVMQGVEWADFMLKNIKEKTYRW